MKCLLSVCLVAVACAGSIAQTLMQSSTETPALMKGVSVEMAPAKNAQPMPEADNADAWVVTVDESGRLYFGANPMTPTGLKEWMISHPRKRDAKLYIKADARATYASVEKALEAANTAEFTSPVLLVSQPGGASGGVVAPKGLGVSLSGATAGSVVVEIGHSGQGSPEVKINHAQTGWDAVPTRLAENLKGRSDKSVLVAADAGVTFADVARVMDACGAAGAKVVLSSPTL